MGGRPGQPKTGGRKAGTPNKATAEIRDLARADGPAIFKELVRLALDKPYGRKTRPRSVVRRSMMPCRFS
jgi:hypothetical protein